MQGDDPRPQIGITAQLLGSRDRPNKPGLGDMAADPVAVDADVFTAIMHGDNGALEHQTNDLLAFRRLCGWGMPESGKIERQFSDGGAFRLRQSDRLSRPEAIIVSLESRFGRQRLLPALLSGADHQTVLRLDRIVLPERAFGFVTGPFQALQPQAVSVGMLRFDVLGDPQADLEGGRPEGMARQSG